MQLLSTAATTGLETIDILTILRSSNISRSTHCSAFTYILNWYLDWFFSYVSFFLERQVAVLYFFLFRGEL